MSDTAFVQILRDRTAISDLLYRFAELLDAKRWRDYIALYTEDGVLELPWQTVTRHALAEAGGPRLLMGLAATQHFSSNHRIEVDGDTACSTSYLLAMHLVRPGESDPLWAVGGSYDNCYRRVDGAWKIVRCKLSVVWEAGRRPN